MKCHLKCTIVDDKAVVLGSGNMDRASWFTSQEVGVAIEDGRLVSWIRVEVQKALERRMEVVYGKMDTENNQ